MTWVDIGILHSVHTDYELLAVPLSEGVMILFARFLTRSWSEFSSSELCRSIGLICCNSLVEAGIYVDQNLSKSWLNQVAKQIGSVSSSPILPEDGSRIQLPKRCTFIVL
jgi:hypothetical protein